MALHGKWAILYYGILASLAGGWLPVRTKSIFLNLFHLVFFLSFILIPFSVYHINSDHWSGWFVYSVLVVFSFIILKIVNSRLHLSLGTNPSTEEDEEERKGSQEGDEMEDTEEEEEEEEEDKKQAEEPGSAEMKTAEGTIEQLSQESSKMEDSLQHHRDSASMLGLTSSARSGGSHIMEMQGDSRGLTNEVNADRESIESFSSDSPLASGRRAPAKLMIPDSALALMSPVHRSSSNVDTSGATALALTSSDASHTHKTYHFSEGEEELEDTGIQRSFSMPPAMFDNEEYRPARNRERSGLCIQRRHRNHQSLMFDQEFGLVSEGQLETTGEKVENKDGNGRNEGNVSDSYPRGRRNAFRGGERAVRRATYAVDGSTPASEAGYSGIVSRRGGGAEGTGTPTVGSSSTFIPMISEEAESVGLSLEQQVKITLDSNGHHYLVDCVHIMCKPLQQALLNDTLPMSWYLSIKERIGELKRGHLASDESDNTPGAVHWFEDNGEWDFYIFRSDEVTSEPFMDEDSIPVEELLAYNVFMDNIHSALPALSAGLPPRPPPRLPNISASSNEKDAEEEEKKPVYQVIPFVKKTEITLNFPRRALEEYMDRNVKWVESLFTIILAMLVCVVAILLLTVIDFYHGFWVFWFCFVVATAHFSLIKSVQDDPASPSPGQNNIMAMGRAIYFILCGSIALSIDAALRHIDTFPPLCVYGFNINNEPVFMFVRNGLLIFILFFPILFTLGWLPQADTFAIYFMEQVDIHVFGGTASTGLICSVYASIRNFVVCGVLVSLGYAAFSQLETQGERLTCSSEDFSPNDPRGMCNFQNRIVFAIYVGVLFAASFVLSRNTSNHQYLWDLILRGCRKIWSVCSVVDKKKEAVPSDPLEDIYCSTLKKRLLSDLMVAIVVFVVTVSLSISTVFCRSIIPAYIVYGLTCVLGAFNHYILPHLKKEMPWLCWSEPIVKPKEWDAFEVTVAPVLSPIEWVLQWLLFVEKNILYPLTFLFALQLSAHHYRARFGDIGAAVALTIIGIKIIRTAWTDLPRQYQVLIFTLFFFNFDYAHLSEGLPFDYFISAILLAKFYDLFLKIYFIFIYIAPWQSSWSSASHIIVQPLLIPHTPFIFLMTLISSIVSAPMNPIYASTFFFLSYVRPVKYWEKDYNTKRSDSSNTRLDTQLEGSLRNPNPDRLDSLFYEHLTWVLQKDLCGDVLLGRWGKVASGDFFILTSDRLNALVHIIEYGNGFVTFQLRGLEFRGTYCHQREVEAITESIADDDGCCSYEPGHLPGMLSCNKVFSSRWLAWEVVSSCYTLHGYSISENQAHLVFNSFDYRRGYITYYIKCIIYKLVRWSRLKSLLENESLQAALREQSSPLYCDRDPLFDESRNSDFSHRFGGILKERFVTDYQPFVRICVEREGLDVDCGINSFLLTLAFAFTLLGRRMFYQHAQQGFGRRNGDNFMNGLYRMFLGDARPNSQNDEWVFQDVDSIKDVIIPATRISLKVHQDNFSFSEEYESPSGVYDAIKEVDENHIVTHENDHNWRTAVVTNQPSLLALRYQRTEESYIYPYKLIRLTSKFIKFRVIKVNRECVRSLWTSQQHELIFLRNSDSERGSIQNHKPTLRNMINSSMDLPIGYPIYVSPLQTSFVDRHETFNGTVLSKLTDPLKIFSYLGALQGTCGKCKTFCAKKVNRGTSRNQNNKGDISQIPTANEPSIAEGNFQRRESVDSLTGIEYEEAKPADALPSDSDSEEQLWKPMWVLKQVVVTDTTQIFENFKMTWLKWREGDEAMANKAQKSHWKAWRPQEGMEGEVIHEWRPFHIDPVQRSHIDKVILLVKMTEDLYVLIKEQGVKEVHNDSVI